MTRSEDWWMSLVASVWSRSELATSEFRAKDVESQRKLIETLVSEAGAVDGVTGLMEPTVDGLPLITYLQTLSGIRALLGCTP